MERYLLDTNILTFLILGEYDAIAKDTACILEDASNVLYVSSVSVSELLQLYRIKKIKPKQFKNAQELHDTIENDFYIKILPFAKEHTATLSKLSVVENHNDPFDHAIISHAITEKLTLISSDGKFKYYTDQKLKFVFNKR